MILKKPYRFLIKYFKIIHILMFIIFVYFAIKLRAIYQFFTNYVQNGSFTYIEEKFSNYVPIFVFLLIILILVGTIFIYSLMKKKQKPILFYKILLVYSVILFITMIYMYNFFATADNVEYNALVTVINRDIALAVYIVNYFYVFFTFIRGFGFDIKKFSFEQDKKELDIEESDNEEFEVSIDIDKDDVSTRVKHEKRQLIYYIKENATFFTILLIIILVIIGYNVYNKVFVENRIYHQSDVIELGNISYKVNKSYIFRLDKNSDIISKNHYYVVVDINIFNSGNEIILNKEEFRAYVNKNYYYPVYNYYDIFDDLGVENSFVNKIKASSNENYLLVFEIKNEDTGKVYLEILNNNKKYTFNKIKLDPLKEDKQVVDYKIGEEFIINGNVLKVSQYEFLERTTYTFNECIKEGDCRELTKTIKPDYNEIVFKVNISNIKSIDNDFIEDYFGIKYNDKDISSKSVKLLGINENNLYFSVPKGVLTNYELFLTIKTRNNEYYVNLGV